MFSRAAGVVVVALVLAPISTAAPSDVWKKLHRPLHIGTLPLAAPCPVSAPSRVDLGIAGVRMLPGRGPAYPNFPNRKPLLEFFWPPLPAQIDFYGTGWSGNKVLWWIAGTYTGPVLIRGRRVDGPELVRFDRGHPPPLELRIPAGRGTHYTKGARDRPSYTRVQAPGCYAYQVDGTTFSRVIVFEARVILPPSFG